MGSKKRKNNAKHQGRQKNQHKNSILSICSVMILMSVIIAVSSMSLQAKNKSYKAQEKELQRRLEEEKVREQEIEDLREYVGTDAYIEDVAKDKLGLIYENEILFQPET